MVRRPEPSINRGSTVLSLRGGKKVPTHTRAVLLHAVVQKRGETRHRGVRVEEFAATCARVARRRLHSTTSLTREAQNFSSTCTASYAKSSVTPPLLLPFPLRPSSPPPNLCIPARVSIDRVRENCSIENVQLLRSRDAFSSLRSFSIRSSRGGKPTAGSTRLRGWSTKHTVEGLISRYIGVFSLLLSLLLLFLS